MNASNDRSTGNHPSVRSMDAAGTTVLVIDDSQTIRNSASQYLSAAGCTVVTAEDGFEALAKVVEYEPAMIFADIMMPRLDGYQTCALIKNNAHYQSIPVVMLSSKDGLFDKARARVVGSDAHISKPFTRESLLAAVHKYTVARRQPPEKSSESNQSESNQNVETSDA